jgi:hypothetical protein
MTRSRSMTELGELRLVVLPPARWEVVVDSIYNAVLVPLSWILVLVEWEPPGRPKPSQFRVVAINGRGDRRTIELAGSHASAARAARGHESRIASVGLSAWSEEMRYRIPAAFFTSA